MLIETEDRLVMIDTGMGRKKPEKYYKFKYISGDDSVAKGFEELGYSFDQVTDVILTHLHDDHVGGAVYHDEDGNPQLTFPNATHWISKAQWDWAYNPNKREAGTFFRENFVPIQEAGKLALVEEEGEHIPNVNFKIYNGHTIGQMIPHIQYQDKTIVYMADFIPTVAHLPIHYIAGVDIQPIIALEEKEAFLNEAAEKGYYMFFQHDYHHEMCTVQHGSKGVELKESLLLKDL
jgi:glyoxylase-like metal-dependent hydrolase (beta-lactamase superfamily II)